MKIDRRRVFMARDKYRPGVIVSTDTDAFISGRGKRCNHGPDLVLLPAVPRARTA